MTNWCLDCGADLTLVGSVHRCVPRRQDSAETVPSGTVRGTYKYRNADAWRSYMANYMRGYRRKQRETD